MRGTFMGELDTDTIGLVVLVVALAAFFIACIALRFRKCAPD